MHRLWRDLRNLLHRGRHQGRHQSAALPQVWEWEYEESNNIRSNSIANEPMKNKQRFLFLTFLIPMMMNVNAQNQNSSSQLINTGSELLRINTAKNSIECSSNGGRSWVTRCSNSTSYGTFISLLPYGREILACTSKGLYASQNQGRSFSPRCTNTSSYGDFLSLMQNGNELLANTSKGLYYSRNEGRSWVKR